MSERCDRKRQLRRHNRPTSMTSGRRIECDFALVPAGEGRRCTARIFTLGCRLAVSGSGISVEPESGRTATPLATTKPPDESAPTGVDSAQIPFVASEHVFSHTHPHRTRTGLTTGDLPGCEPHERWRATFSTSLHARTGDSSCVNTGVARGHLLLRSGSGSRGEMSSVAGRNVITPFSNHVSVGFSVFVAELTWTAVTVHQTPRRSDSRRARRRCDATGVPRPRS